jgi:hypothetical protein
MKPSLVLALALALATGGCSTTDSPQTRAAYGANTDDAAMSAVETSAANRGVRVYWVHPPEMPAKKASDGG